MSINKIVLETDGLVVGDNQLVASGGGVSIGQNLVVQGNTYTGNIISSNVVTQTLYATQIYFPANNATGSPSQTITGATTLEKQYTKLGALTPYTDISTRFYPSAPIVITSAIARLGTAPQGANATFSICKNGSPSANLTILSSSLSSTDVIPNLTANTGDYFSININTVGALIPGADLYITLKYYRI
jgi:hypothetical protein